MEVQRFGRYALLPPFAMGGMGSMHVALRSGALGVKRVCAVKRLHPHIARDVEAVATLTDEARVTSQIMSVHVPAVIEIAREGDELLLACEYVHGVSIAELRARCGGPFPRDIAVGIVEQTLRGLHVAHEVRAEDGLPLGVVHRDVSPQNVIVGFDGVVRVVDFGIARSRFRLHTTEDGRIKGKLGYMAPEQLEGGAIDRRADLYAVGVLLWEMLTGQRLFGHEEKAGRRRAVGLAELTLEPEALTRIVARALAAAPDDRFEDAEEMCRALVDLRVGCDAEALAKFAREVASDVEDERGALLDFIRSVPQLTVEEPTRNAVTRTEERPDRRPARSFVPFIALVVAFAAFFVAVRRGTPPTTAAPVVATTAVTPTLSPSPERAVPQNASASVTTTLLSEKTAPRPAARNPPKPVASVVSSPCAPPWTVDDAGIRVYKPECL